MPELKTYKVSVKWNGGTFNITRPRWFDITTQAENEAAAEREIAELCGRGGGEAAPWIKGMDVLDCIALEMPIPAAGPT